MAGGTFRSLKVFNFRVWAAGSLVSNIGSWMQRTAQDWLVLTALTHNNASAVGIVVALQFAPQVLLLPVTGYAADHFDKRKLIFATQTAMGLLALALGILVVTGLVRLWQVDIFAFLLGCAAAFDMPARQAFVSELVGEADLGNALALNSTSFNAARMIGPAAAGLLIAAVGTGAVFLINAASFLAVLASLVCLRGDALHSRDRSERRRGGLIEGFRYVWQRGDLKTILLMLLVVGMFGLNFPIFISTMAVSVFHAGAGRFGFLTSMMALGSIAGALFTARRGNPNMQILLVGALLFGLACGLAALTPTYIFFGLVLVIVGFAVQTFTTSTNSLVQLSIPPQMRGRVLAILLAIALGGTPLGAPIIGWVADRLGPRVALGLGAASGFVAAMIACAYLVRYSSRPDIRPDKAREA
ncbi:MAG: MFS transporter [Methylovirgula sp.]|uniref:MFS transporter n=1 Tax=Methylovirgula sp. TaxID=1978224 RepID=UPI00307645AC